MASLVLAGAVVVPWIFTISLQDSFTLPKLVALWTLLAVVVSAVALDALRGHRVLGRLHAGPIDVAVVFFLVWNLVAFALSTDRHQSLFGERLQHQGLLTLFLYLGFFYVGRLGLSSVRKLGLLLVAVATSGFAVAAYAWIQRAGLDPIWGRLKDGRAFSTLGQSNAMAAFLVFAIGASLGLAWSRAFGGRRFWLGAAAFMAVAMLFSQSRGGDLGLCASLGIFSLAMLRTRRSAAVLLGAIVALVLGGTLGSAFFPPVRSFERQQWRRAASSLDVKGDLSARMHLDTWTIGLRMALDHPVVGAGQEIFPELFPRYRESLLSPSHARAFRPFRVESPHNVYLAIADGAGFPALAAYLALVGFVAFAAWRGIRSSRTGAERAIFVAALTVLAGHLVTDSFMTAEVTGSWLFWLSSGAVVGSVQAIRRGPVEPAGSVPSSSWVEAPVQA